LGVGWLSRVAFGGGGGPAAAYTAKAIPDARALAPPAPPTPPPTAPARAGGGLLWKRELAPAGSLETFTSIAVDPLDARRVVLCGDAGALLVLRLKGLEAGGGNGGGASGAGGAASSTGGAASSAGGGGGGGARDEVQQTQYRVNVQPAAGGAERERGGGGGGERAPALRLQARFAATRDLLVVLLPRELLVFDLELGQPAASSALPPARPPFSGLLGACGEGVSQVGT
jgi:hypothetical protein